MHPSKRFVDEVVELSRDCELGQEGDRGVVTALDGHYMTLTFPNRGPDNRDVHTGADYKHLRAYEGTPWAMRRPAASVKTTSPVTREASLRELRALVATYLEGSDDASLAVELLAALDAPLAMIPDGPAREMFGCTAAAIDEALAGKEPRLIAMYAMGTLSNAQELIQRHVYEGKVEWSITDRHANTIRQLINIAKYAIDKAVPR